jgi:hypothetical protein
MHRPVFAEARQVPPQLHPHHGTEKKLEKKKKERYRLSGGESNPGLLRVVLSNDKQKY